MAFSLVFCVLFVVGSFVLVLVLFAWVLVVVLLAAVLCVVFGGGAMVGVGV